MNRTLIALSIVSALGLSACSSTKSLLGDNNTGVTPAHNNEVAVKDTTLSTDFTDEGVKIFYTLGGKLEKIEVYGQAEAWKGNVDVLAEADAMSKLVKFVHGKQVSSERTVRVIGKAIEQASDHTQNQIKSQDGTVATVAADLEKPDSLLAPNAAGDGEQKQKSNTAIRKASIVNTTLTNTVDTITASGKLRGVHKVRDFKRDNGRVYVAVYQWSEQGQATSEFVRARMLGIKQ